MDSAEAQERHEEFEAGRAEPPRYRCHKEVYALRITDVVLADAEDDQVWLLHVVGAHDQGAFEPIRVDKTWVDRHQPQPGGYWVQYDLQPGETEPYTSFSPAAAFESGYRRIA